MRLPRQCHFHSSRLLLGVAWVVAYFHHDATVPCVQAQSALGDAAIDFYAPYESIGIERHLAYLSTDRLTYRQFETVFINAFVLDQLNNTPPYRSYERTVNARFSIAGPSGASVVDPTTRSVMNGVSSYVWQIPGDAPGGEYTIRFDGGQYHSIPPVEREIRIQAYTAPKLKTVIEFDREGYGPLDRVVVDVYVEEIVTGDVPNDSEVEFTARIDGDVVYESTSPEPVSVSGRATIGFDIPGSITGTNGVVTAIVVTDGLRESKSKTIPLVASHLDIAVFPEGGELVEGVLCGLYFEALLPWGKPADFTGVICETDVNNASVCLDEIVDIETVHEGRGYAQFTPEANKDYHIRVYEPATVKTVVNLPAAVSGVGAVSLVADDSVFAATSVEVTLRAPSTGNFTVYLSKRERVIGRASVVFTGANGGSLTRTIPIDAAFANISGVLRVTAFSEDLGRPVAERLVFRHQQRQLRVTADLSRNVNIYQPGDTVSFTLTVTDTETGEPVSDAVVNLAVSDDSIRSLTEERELPPRLDDMVLLENEVAEFYDAGAYLTRDADGDQNIDLLLGTQGWRRFVFWDPQAGLRHAGDDFELAAQMQRIMGVANITDSVRRVYSSTIVSRYQDGEVASVLAIPITLMCISLVCVVLPCIARRRKKVIRFFVGDGAPASVPSAQSLPVAEDARLVTQPQSHEAVASSAPPANVDAIPEAKESIQPAPSVNSVGEEAEPGMAPVPPADAQAKLKNGDVKRPPPSMSGCSCVWSVVWCVLAAIFALVAVFIGSVLPTLRTTQPLYEVRPLFGTDLGEDRFGGGGGDFELVGAVPAFEAGIEVPGDEESPGDYVAAPDVEGALSAGGIAEPFFGGFAQAVLPVVGGMATFWAETAEAETVLFTDTDAPSPRGLNTWERQYRHVRRAGWVRGVRADFTPTIFWSAASTTDSAGEVWASFILSDAVTSFRIFADIVAEDGTIASSMDRLVPSEDAFYIDMVLPAVVTQGDVLDIPVVITNNFVQDVQISLSVREIGNHDVLTSFTASSVSVEADSSTRVSATGVAVSVDVLAEQTTLIAEVTVFENTPDEYTVTVIREVRVLPRGFPHQVDASGVFAANAPFETTFEIQDNVYQSSIETSVVAYLNPVGSLTEALRSLIRKPYGCFEQTSSTTYPMVMALKYFQTHSTTDIDPQIVKDATAYLDEGYKKLIGYETSTGGFEWFGSSPGHEALTAYGILQFLDMQEVRYVDQAMLDRTIRWLFARRDNNGGFLQSNVALDSFGRAPADITNAYIVWSMVSGGIEGLDAEINHLAENAISHPSPYYRALVAAILYEVDNVAGALPLAQSIVDDQDEDGGVRGTDGTDVSITSITNSRGRNLDIETTSVAILCWLHDTNSFAANARFAMEYLMGQIEGGSFGSTQATVLALKAVIEFDALSSSACEEGSVVFSVDNAAVESVDCASGKATGAVHFEIPEAVLQPNSTHNMSLSYTGSSGISIAASSQLRYSSPLPESSPTPPITITLTASSASVVEGDLIQFEVNVTNTEDREQGMVVATVRLASGLVPRFDQLRELQDANRMSFYEVVNNDLILYFRGMGPNQVRSLTIDTEARFPGTYVAPVAHTYLYYADDDTHWTSADPVQIVAAS